MKLSAYLRYHAPFWLSLVIGIGVWEIAGRSTSAAFMVPFSETMVQLWHLVASGEFIRQFLNSAELFITGVALAVGIGMPFGMLLARVRTLRVGIEPYLMIIYATPMVALIPFILSLMGFGFAPKVLVVFLFAVFPVIYNTIEGARSIKPELLEVARSYRSSEWALWREVMLPYTLPYAMTGVRQAIGRALVGMIAAEFFLSSTGLGQLIMSASQNFDTGGVFASIFVIALIGIGLMRLGLVIERHFARWRPSSMAEQTLPSAAIVTPSSRVNAALVPRLITGLIILLVWELVVRACAPGYVAKPTTVVLAIPRVIVDPAFLSATGSTLLAVAEGLAIALVAGTFIGLLMGRSPVAERSLRHYVNGFYAMPMIVVLPLFSLWFGYSGATRIATIIFAAIFSIVINVADGARSVPREYIEVARSFRGGKLRGLVEIVLPSSMPYLLAGLRLAGGRALIGAVVAEFFVSVGGLGMYILYNSRSYHHNEAFVGVIFLAAFGLSFELLINSVTRRFMPWYRRDEQTG